MKHTVGILAVQGAFAEHEQVLRKLGCDCIELRGAENVHERFDALVLPGGESTVQGKLLVDLGMLDELKHRITEGMPVLGTCAGLILLAQEVEPCDLARKGFGTLPVTVRRNAYGRQLGSFRTHAEFGGLGRVPMTFIRAPFITCAADEDVLARVDGNIVAVRHGNQIGTAFHPELDADDSIHRLFLSLVR